MKNLLLEKAIEYRNRIANALRTARESSSEIAESILKTQRDKEIYHTSQVAVRSERRRAQREASIDSFKAGVQRILLKFQHGSFNRVSTTEVDTAKLKKLGYKTQKEVFVSIGRNSGFELLNAIGKIKKPCTVYVILNQEKVDMNRLRPGEDTCDHITPPFYGFLMAPYKHYKKTIRKAVELAKTKGSAEELLDTNYAGHLSFFMLVSELKENWCPLIEEWFHFLEKNANLLTFEEKTWKTHDSHMGDTRHHSQLTQKPEIMEKLWVEFLKEKSIELILIPSKESWRSKLLPIATSYYQILLNRHRNEFRSLNQHPYNREEGRAKVIDSWFDIRARQDGFHHNGRIVVDEIIIELVARHLLE